MAEADTDVVTGAFGYTGKYITERLLARGRRVRTLTGHSNRPNPFGGRVEVFRSTSTTPPHSLKACAAPPPSSTPTGCASPTAPPPSTAPSRTRRR